MESQLSLGPKLLRAIGESFGFAMADYRDLTFFEALDTVAQVLNDHFQFGREWKDTRSSIERALREARLKQHCLKFIEALCFDNLSIRHPEDGAFLTTEDFHMLDGHEGHRAVALNYLRGFPCAVVDSNGARHTDVDLVVSCDRLYPTDVCTQDPTRTKRFCISDAPVEPVIE